MGGALWGTNPKTWPNNIWHVASTWPTIARLSFNITHKMAKLGPKTVPLWLPASQLAPDCNFALKSTAVAVASKCTSLSPHWLLHHKLCSFSNKTTSTFRQISLDNPQRKLMHPKSCGVGGGRREASGIFEILRQRPPKQLWSLVLLLEIKWNKQLSSWLAVSCEVQSRLETSSFLPVGAGDKPRLTSTSGQGSRIGYQRIPKDTKISKGCQK